MPFGTGALLEKLSGAEFAYLSQCFLSDGRLGSACVSASGLGVSCSNANVVRGRDAMAVPGAWSAMVAAVRNLGRPGIAAMAFSAVDAALWDLKARLLDVPLLAVLGLVCASRPDFRPPASGHGEPPSTNVRETRLAGAAQGSLHGGGDFGHQEISWASRPSPSSTSGRRPNLVPACR
jgi:hypothetical protein